ncbi:hypothetical protein HHK36_028648 [Tetracentron sinense]|uniref:Uncharacterized protein n=1 Tax=Tetracentron sinense TaxID=13715 RepID=A0A834YCU3_TETSI|nr:hypothetical protein HHK36_028648 [Tetracentron sinense]
MTRPHCHYCKKYGHIKKDYRILKYEQERKPEKTKGKASSQANAASEESSDDKAFCTYTKKFKSSHSPGILSKMSRKTIDNAQYLRIGMPRLWKEDVKVLMEQNTLIIKREIIGRRGDPQNLYEANQINAKMKNEVLKSIVSKVNEEEIKDIFEVKIK